MKDKKLLNEMSIDELKSELEFHKKYKHIYPHYVQEIEGEIIKREFDKKVNKTLLH